MTCLLPAMCIYVIWEYSHVHTVVFTNPRGRVYSSVVANEAIVHTIIIMMAVDIDTMSWEGLAADRTKWRSALKQHLKTGEDKPMTAAADKRARRKEGSSSIRPESTHRCDLCNKDCHSRIVSSATSDAAKAQQDINQMKNKNIRMFYP